jgi:hypothetical protein
MATDVTHHGLVQVSRYLGAFAVCLELLALRVFSWYRWPARVEDSLEYVGFHSVRLCNIQNVLFILESAKWYMVQREF